MMTGDTTPRLAEPREDLDALLRLLNLDRYDADTVRSVRTRDDLETLLGHRVEVVTIRCTGHAVNGRVRRPRLAVAARYDHASPWHLGKTFADALLLRGKDQNALYGRDKRPRYRQSTKATECAVCGDRVQHADGPRFARALSALAVMRKHSPTLAELREHYREAG